MRINYEGVTFEPSDKDGFEVNIAHDRVNGEKANENPLMGVLQSCVARVLNDTPAQYFI